MKDEHGVTLMRYRARGVNHYVLSDTKTRWGLQFLTLVPLVAAVVVVASFNILVCSSYYVDLFCAIERFAHYE